MQSLERFGQWGAELMMRYPELTCCILTVFLIGIAVHAASKLRTL